MSDLASLRTVSGLWGADKVEHYRWKEKGKTFCAKLQSAACAVKGWDEAVVKLNRLILRRAPLVGRLEVVSSAPIIWHDLVNLSRWGYRAPYIVNNDRALVLLPYRRLEDAEVPAGFGFDKFGLLVRVEEQTATPHSIASSSTREMTEQSLLWEVARVWGPDKAEHYHWVDEGVGFCTKLRTAARVVRDWDEAAIKLNRLILRRMAQSGRLAVSSPFNLITIDDLTNLTSWYSKEPYVRKNDRECEWLPFRRLDVTEMLAGIGFDEFGLMTGAKASAATEVGAVPRPSLATQTVSYIWGADKVEHYGWMKQTPSFYEKLTAAAREVRDWDEAVVKFNRLILRRATRLGQREIEVSVSPITTGDSVNLRAWCHKGSYLCKNDGEGAELAFRGLEDAEIPVGFVFDQFGLMVRKQVMAHIEAQIETVDGAAAESSEAPQRARKRRLSSDADQARRRQRIRAHAQRSVEDESAELASILAGLEEEFAEKKWLSQEQRWCEPISIDRKVSTVEAFYRAFHDTTTLPIETCLICYRKYARAEVQEFSWGPWAARLAGPREGSLFRCRACFPQCENVLACRDCVAHMRRGVLSPAGQIHACLGCEHVHPDELRDLTPVEEKLIALNSCYGFITRYSIPQSRRQSVMYPKHVKGHITVFPNNVQELVANVLPHSLLKVMDEIHVSWQGIEKPNPKDLSVLLSVRRRVVERALVWLKRNNPLYASIRIDTAEMDRWSAPIHGIPPQLYDRLERNEPSGQERARTGQIVPATERGLEEDVPKDIREIMAELNEASRLSLRPEEMGQVDESRREGEAAGDGGEVIHEISVSGMFPLDAPPDVRDADRLQSVWESLRLGAGAWGSAKGSSRLPGSSLAWNARTQEPYIAVSRGADFADSLDARFFAKTFPSLFPHGSGGPRRAEESMSEITEGGATSLEGDSFALRLVATRNMSVEAWTRIILRRHGGRFAAHPIFSFLVFNMCVRWRNRRVSMLSVSRREFPRVEQIVHSLTTERLEKAKAELEKSAKTIDEGVNQLLRSLSLYGYRQPMSRESRMSMRRKIKSLIIRYGIPAIWFTLNPNDITNPVKLRLAAHRFRSPDEAEEFLSNLDLTYKRAKLAISDPLSSADFFHREISMFFEHYVKVGEDSVFGRISQYFGAVETNERGALHIHGLLWLQGNLHLSSILKDVQIEDQATYRDQIIRYVDSVFAEVSAPQKVTSLCCFY